MDIMSQFMVLIKLEKRNYQIKRLFNIQDVDRDIPELSKILSILWDSVTKKCLTIIQYA